MLYTAKGTASLLVPLSVVQQATGGWHGVFIVAIGANLVAAAMAMFVLKPLRRRCGPARRSAVDPGAGRWALLPVNAYLAEAPVGDVAPADLF